MKISASINKMVDNPDSATKAFASVTLDGMFVLLSTCSYEFDNARTVLTGRLVEMEGDINE